MGDILHEPRLPVRQGKREERGTVWTMEITHKEKGRSDGSASLQMGISSPRLGLMNGQLYYS